jgi:hypothetical protein
MIRQLLRVKCHTAPVSARHVIAHHADKDASEAAEFEPLISRIQPSSNCRRRYSQKDISERPISFSTREYRDSHSPATISGRELCSNAELMVRDAPSAAAYRRISFQHVILPIICSASRLALFNLYLSDDYSPLTCAATAWPYSSLANKATTLILTASRRP